jgi:thiamine-phosphate pyrophosphorylase
MTRANEHAVAGLYAVTPDEADTARLVRLVDAAIAGGAQLVQYRNKTASPGLRVEQARALMRICRHAGVPLIVNDHPDIAAEVDADGIHLGQDDGDVAAARARFPEALLGVSCYNDIARALEAKRLGADYVAFGRFFPSVTKPGTIRATLALVAQAKREVGLPIVAIGGITLENASSLLAGGVDALAVIAALFGSTDVHDTASRFAALFLRESKNEQR